MKGFTIAIHDWWHNTAGSSAVGTCSLNIDVTGKNLCLFITHSNEPRPLQHVTPEGKFIDKLQYTHMLAKYIKYEMKNQSCSNYCKNQKNVKYGSCYVETHNIFRMPLGIIVSFFTIVFLNLQIKQKCCHHTYACYVAIHTLMYMSQVWSYVSIQYHTCTHMQFHTGYIAIKIQQKSLQ